MLGHLSSVNPEIDGLQPGQQYCQPNDPLDPSGPQTCVQFDAIDGGPDDPAHDFDSITQQVYGYAKPENVTAPVTMNGFVANAEAKKGNTGFVMSAHNFSDLPVMSTLALEFALFDHWHVSIPTCTNPNREAAMSGTSSGVLDNNFPADGFKQQTHFTWLAERGESWSIY